MDIATLDKIFKPQRIALIGVSPNPKSVGGKILSNLVGGGFRGVVYPVSPSAEAVDGHPLLPGHRVASQGPRPRHRLRRRGPGPRPRPRVRPGRRRRPDHRLRRLPGDRARRAGPRRVRPRRSPPLRGHADPRAELPGLHRRPAALSTPASPAAMPRPGHVAFVSQSGALCTSVLDWAVEEKIGFSHFVSIGNMLDVDFGDLIDYLGEDEETKSIILYIESVKDARKFMTAGPRLRPDEAHRRLQGRPLPGIRRSGRLATPAPWPGRTPSTTPPSAAWAWPGSSISARSSTASTSSAAPRSPRDRAWPSLTNAGGPAVMATDALVASGGTLARLSDGDREASSTRTCRRSGRTAIPWTSWATPSPSSSPRRPISCSRTPASTPSSSSSRPRP